MSKHIQGQDCTCAARSQHECACDADWTRAEVYELRARVKDLEKQIARFLNPGPPFDPAPSKEYEGLLRQFRAAVNIIRSKQAQLSIYAEKNYQIDRDKHLSAIENLNSEKDMNARLTEELEILSRKYEELQQELKEVA